MTLKERRKRELELRRETVITIANKLFFLDGYENVTMDDIAREGEISKATLYSYFKDKESLFCVIVNRGIKILRDMIYEEEELMKARYTKLGVIKTACDRFILEYPEYARAYIYFRSGKFNVSDENSRNTDAKEVFEFTKELFEKVTLEVKIGIENGTLRPDVNPVLVTAMYISIYDNTLLTLSSDLIEMLKTNGITVQHFYLEFTNLLYRMIINNEESNRNNEGMNKNSLFTEATEYNHSFYTWDKEGLRSE